MGEQLNQDSKFETIWQYDIEPRLKSLETYRQEKKRIHDIVYKMMFVFLAIASLIAVIGLIIKRLDSPYCFTSSLVFFLLSCICGEIIKRIAKKFRNDIKSVLLLPILSPFGNFSIFEKEVIKLREIKKLKLYKRAHNKKDDDNVVGVYRDVPIAIVETELYHKVGKHSTETDFEGLILKIGYNTYDETKKILSDCFMEKFQQFKFDFSFKGIQYGFSDGFLYLFIERPEFCRCGDGFFEVGNISGTLINKETFQKNYNELVALFALVDEIVQKK